MSTPILLATPARADDNTQAASLAREAEKLIAAGDVAQACNKLQQRQKLAASGSAALDLAVCRQKEGKLGSAYRAYGVALDWAKKEKRFDRIRRAKQARNKLYLRLPRLTLKVDEEAAPAGLTITINGAVIPASAWNKPYPVDPGNLDVQATATGKTSWHSTLNIAAGKRKTVAVPSLDDAAVKSTPAPADDDDAPPAASDRRADDDSTPTDEDNDHDDNHASPSDDHASLRPVIELGAVGGLMISAVERGGAAALAGTNYLIASNTGGRFFATCGDTASFPGSGTCDAALATMLGGVVGGTLFGGVSLDARVHVGGRVFAGKRFPDGFWLAGGPSGSFRVAGPLWLGATVLFGTEEHRADINSARGSVPADLQSANGGEFVNIGVGPGSKEPQLVEAQVAAGLLIGGSLEISMALLGPSPHAVVPTGRHDFLDGSMMISLHPSVMVGSAGMIITVPAAVGYRFH